MRNTCKLYVYNALYEYIYFAILIYANIYYMFILNSSDVVVNEKHAVI